VIYKNNNSSYLKRIELASKLIDTKYCLLAADDDFYLFKEILKSINFLENNQSYKSYFGQVLSFYYKNKNKFYVQNYKNIKSNNISRRNIYDRLSIFGKNYHPSSIYAVTRTTDWIHNWKNVSNCAVNIAGEHEILYEMYSIISGKRKIHERVCLIRSNEHVITRSGDKSIDGVSLGYNWRNNSLIRNKLVKNILKNNNVSLKSKNIVQFFEDYTNNINETDKNSKSVKKYLKDIFSSFHIFFNLVSFYNILNGNKFKDLEKSGFFFKKHKILIDMKDLKNVNETINLFNET
tara:strand:+ start:2082 stop:2957 length:876 start_codon:yes stop_codon:yes gene_type:complete